MASEAAKALEYVSEYQCELDLPFNRDGETETSRIDSRFNSRRTLVEIYAPDGRLIFSIQESTKKQLPIKESSSYLSGTVKIFSLEQSDWV